MTRGPEPTGLTFNDALALKLEEAGWTRRDFLSRVAALGAATALTQLLIACGARQPGQATQQVAAETALPTGTPAPGVTAGPTAAPTPVPQPESELNVYNWSYYIGRETREKFEQTYGIKLNYDRFPDENTQIGKLLSDGKGGGYDVSYPASTWIPSFIEQGVIQKLDHSLIPNIANLAAPVARPGLRPGQPVLGAVLLVDDRVRLGSGQDPRGPDELGCPLGRGHTPTGCPCSTTCASASPPARTVSGSTRTRRTWPSSTRSWPSCRPRSRSSSATRPTTSPTCSTASSTSPTAGPGTGSR